ncbi:MAG: hypothetical protein EXS10_09830 [Phycisphaerales bacterium]|nr:hypothetical protein [Phycisphaerales bacterium]
MRVACSATVRLVESMTPMAMARMRLVFRWKIGRSAARTARTKSRAVTICNEVDGSLRTIVLGTKEVNGLLTQISGASKEQAQGISQVNSGVSELDKVTQQNAGNSEELSAASEETASQVTQLKGLLGQFKTGG